MRRNVIYYLVIISLAVVITMILTQLGGIVENVWHQKVEKEFSTEKIYVDRIYMHGVNDFSVAVIKNGEVRHFKPIESVDECRVRIFLDAKEDEKPWVLVYHPRMEIHIHSLDDIQSVGM